MANSNSNAGAPALFGETGPWRQGFLEPLLLWYEKNARVLPWRESPTPYRVLVSEVMLQQTRVSAALPYFERFMAALPTFEALATCEPDYLRKLWQGLGYYSRAQNLRRAAQLLCSEHGGVLPKDYEALRRLPGVGDYTAGAVLSIAFNIPHAAVDGNVIRVLTRFCGVPTDQNTPKAKAALAGFIGSWMPKNRARDFTQALMELGALICRPTGAPLCESCPVAPHCAALRLGLQGELPRKAPKKARIQEHRTVFLIACQGRLLLHKRPDTGLLASLWELPNTEGALAKRDAAAHLNSLGLSVRRLCALHKAKHIFTHREWLLSGYLAHTLSPLPPAGEYLFATAGEIQEHYAVPSAFRAFTALLPDCLNEDFTP